MRDEKNATKIISHEDTNEKAEIDFTAFSDMERSEMDRALNAYLSRFLWINVFPDK